MGNIVMINLIIKTFEIHWLEPIFSLETKI